MAMYEPIRDAFREMNNLMLDSQQWDERRAQINSDREFKQQMLMSELEQRRFNNDMAVKEGLLRERGEQRLADGAAFRRFDANRKWEVEKELAADNQEWHGERMAKSQMERDKMQRELDEEQKFLDQRDEWLQTNTDEVFQDPIEKASQAGNAIGAELRTLEARYKKLDPNNNRTTGMRGILKERINAARAKFEKATANLHSSKTRVQTWRDQADAARELAPLWMRHEPGTGQALLRIADAYDKRADSDEANDLARAKMTAKQKEDTSYKDRFDRYSKFYGDLDANNQIFLTEGAQGRVAIAQTVAQKYADEGKGSPGQLFLIGLNAVDKVENKLQNDLAIIARNEEGLLNRKEVQDAMVKRVQKFRETYQYVPEYASKLDIPGD